MKIQSSPDRKAAISTKSDLAPIERGYARVASFLPDSIWMLRGRQVRIDALVEVNLARIQDLETGAHESVPIAVLKPVVQRCDGPAEQGAQDLEHFSAEDWERALDLEARVKRFLTEAHHDIAKRKALAASVGLSDRQLRRKIKEYVETETVEVFLPGRPVPSVGSPNLDTDLERLIEEQIQRALKDSPDVSVDDLCPLIGLSAQELGLQRPSRSTIARRLKAARQRSSNLPSPIKKELDRKNRPVRGSIASECPLDTAEMDHTIVDVHLIEPRTRRVIGRPVLTILIDRFTRIILGMLLSFEAPSRLSVALCLHHAVFPKHEWLESLGVPDACWPGYGLMNRIYTDNAAEFHSLSLNRSAQLFGINLGFRPPGQPAAGGIVERAIGTLMTKARLLPGSSYSKLLGKLPKNGHQRARMTLAELHLYFARQISIYHKSTNSGLGMPPLTAWERGWVINGSQASPRLPAQRDAFLRGVFPGDWRTVTREGIEIFSRRYKSPALDEHIRKGEKQMIRYDPRDISKVFLETSDAYVPAQVTGDQTAFSLWEWDEYRTKQIAEGRSRSLEVIGREIEENRRLIESTASRSSTAVKARRLARQDAWVAAQDSDKCSAMSEEISPSGVDLPEEQVAPINKSLRLVWSGL